MSNPIAIKPRAPITLTAELDFAAIYRELNQNDDVLTYFIYIIQVAGIQVYPFMSSSSGAFNGSQVLLSIVQSDIEFYINNSLAFECSKELIPSLSGNSEPFAFTFFNSFESVVFTTSSKYPIQPICPYVFSYAKCDLTIFNQINTFLIVNLIKFQAINETSSIQFILFY
jgi:hypothetical protein